MKIDLRSPVDFVVCLGILFGAMVVAAKILDGFDRLWGKFLIWRLWRSLRRCGRRP